MDKVKIDRIHSQFLKELMDKYFHNQGYELDKKEGRIFKRDIHFSLHIETSKGPYFTIRPLTVLERPDLIAKINKVLANPILNNGFFVWSKNIEQHLKLVASGFDGKEDVDTYGLSKMYLLKFFDEYDVPKNVDWIINYTTSITEIILKNLQTENDIYDFYKDIF